MSEAFPLSSNVIDIRRAARRWQEASWMLRCERAVDAARDAHDLLNRLQTLDALTSCEAAMTAAWELLREAKAACSACADQSRNGYHMVLIGKEEGRLALVQARLDRDAAVIRRESSAARAKVIQFRPSTRAAAR